MERGNNAIYSDNRKRGIFSQSLRGAECMQNCHYSSNNSEVFFGSVYDQQKGAFDNKKKFIIYTYTCNIGISSSSKCRCHGSCNCWRLFFVLSSKTIFFSSCFVHLSPKKRYGYRLCFNDLTILLLLQLNSNHIFACVFTPEEEKVTRAICTFSSHLNLPSGDFFLISGRKQG